MADAGYFRGTSAEQDNRFSDKEKKLLKQMRFADSIGTKVEMSKVHLESLKPWISQRISELLGMEDDVLQEFVFNQLEADKFPDGRRIQINLTGFLNGKNARIFTGELWDMLIAAQESASGIPPSLVSAKKEELRLRTEEQERLNETLKRTVSRFQDKLRNDSPPNHKGGRSPTPPRTTKQNSKSNDGNDRHQSESRRKEESQSQNRRQYRSRRSASASPPPPKDRSRSRSRDRETRGKRDIVTHPDRHIDRRDRNRRSRSRSPRYRRHSPTWSRQTQQRRDYVQTTMDRSSHRKNKTDSLETVDRTKRRSRSRTPSTPAQPAKQPNDEIEPELVTATETPSGEPETSPARSSDSGSPRDMKRESAGSDDDENPDQSKKNKKKSKKHKKHKKHKRSKRDEEGQSEGRKNPLSEELERALREKALESMKRAYEKSLQNN